MTEEMKTNAGAPKARRPYHRAFKKRTDSVNANKAQQKDLR